MAISERNTSEATTIKADIAARVGDEVNAAVAREIGELHVGAIDRALQRGDPEIALLELILVIGQKERHRPQIAVRVVRVDGARRADIDPRRVIQLPIGPRQLRQDRPQT